MMVKRLGYRLIALIVPLFAAGCGSSGKDSTQKDPAKAADGSAKSCDELKKPRYGKGGKFCEIHCCFTNINGDKHSYRCPSFATWASCTGRPDARKCIDGCDNDAKCEQDCYSNATPGKPDPSECYEDPDFTEAMCDKEIARIKAGDCWDPPASQAEIEKCEQANKPDAGSPAADAGSTGKYCELFCCFINDDGYRCPTYADWAQCMGRGSARSCIEKCDKDPGCEQDCFDKVFPPGPPDPSACFKEPGYTEQKCDAEIELVKQGKCWDP
jgi:hypothetical protein